MANALDGLWVANQSYVTRHDVPGTDQIVGRTFTPGTVGYRWIKLARKAQRVADKTRFVELCLARFDTAHAGPFYQLRPIEHYGRR